MPSIGATEIIIIVAVVLVLFGGKKLPEFFKGLGSGIKELRNASKDDNSEKGNSSSNSNPSSSSSTTTNT
ncbi:MAG: hypothetical protein Kapaf2KO_09610 [Candidatus Kapaibacteriales bacterium]